MFFGSFPVLPGSVRSDVMPSLLFRSIKSRQDFSDVLRGLKIGDRIIVQVERSGSRQTIPVEITGYKIPVVHLISEGTRSAERQELFRHWGEGG